MAWPETPFQVEQELATIEEKYAEELVQCKGLAFKPEPTRRFQALIQTVQTKAKAAGSTPKAPKDGQTVAPLLDYESVKREDPAPTTVTFAYAVPVEKMVTVPPPDPTSLQTLTWERLAAHGLLQAYLLHGGTNAHVDVLFCQASDPHVYQARALKPFEVGSLVLVPFSSSLTLLSDAAKLNHPKSLHPHLPFTVTVEAGCFDLEDTAKFVVKSPLLDKKLSHAPPAFWAVCRAQQPDDANMTQETARIKMFTPRCEIPELDVRKPAKKRAKKDEKKNDPDGKHELVVEVPVYINSKALTRGDALVLADPPKK